MPSNIHPMPQGPAFLANHRARAVPLAITILVWLFAATFETGYVAVLDTGIQPGEQTRSLA